MAADTVSGYIQALIEGAELSFTHYALDRSSRKAALARFLAPRPDSAPTVVPNEERLAACFRPFCHFRFSRLLMVAGGALRRDLDEMEDRKSTRLNSSH